MMPELSQAVDVSPDNVMSILGASVKNQRDQANAIALMYETIERAVSDVHQIEGRVLETERRMSQMAQEVKDQIRLLPSELAELYDQVAARSIQQAKLHKDEAEEGFAKLVGRLRHKIWRELNKRCGVSRYVFIRRSDFEMAMGYVGSFDVTDFV